MASTYKLKRVCEIKTKIEKLLQDNNQSLSPINSTSVVARTSDSSRSLPGRKCTQNKALVLLKTLNGLQLDLDILTSSKIGMTVNAMRKNSDDPAVQQLAKSLLKKWKKMLEEEVQQQGPNSPIPKDSHADTKQQLEETAQPKKRKKINQSESSSKKPAPPQETEERNKSEEASVRIGDVSEPTTIESNESKNEFRTKSRKLLLDALSCDELFESGPSPEVLVDQLEGFIFNELKDTGFRYKSRIRSRLSNLRDVRNPDLKLMFLMGKISPQMLATMTAEEMASNEMKLLRAKLAKEAIDNAQLAINPGTKNSFIKCGKCRQHNCTYNQLQTQSADEPMTTFVLCNSCGHRFKFN